MTAGIEGLRLLSPADIASLPDLEFLVDGILPVPAFGVFYGPPGSGKSFVALSMALAVCSGQDWIGRSTRQQQVLYVAAEGALGMKLRLAAHRERLGVCDDDLRFIGIPFNVRELADIDALLAAIKAADFKPGLIIIDTLARVAVGADENSAQAIGEVVEGFEHIRRETGATVLVIHHTTKDGLSERGSSALRGAADVMISCKSAQGDGGKLGAELKCEKMKDDEPFKSFTVALEKVELPSGKASLVVTGTLDVVGSLFDHGTSIVELLETRFAADGASNTELLKAFQEITNVSKSTFDRTMRELKAANRVRVAGSEKRPRYFPIASAPTNNEKKDA
jgi:KaiC/GvpD/RAD55 family RecA-like ATPase